MKISESPEILKIYQWASEYTAENVFEKALSIKNRVKDFYETEEFRRIMFKALNQRRGLIGIFGLQGSGKTRTLYELEARLWERINKEKEEKEYVVLIKWTKNVINDLIKNLPYFYDIFTKFANSYLNEELEVYGRAHKRHPKLGRVPTRDDLGRGLADLLFDYGYDKLIPKGKLRELKEQAVYSGFSRTRYVLIDMPDYTKSTAHRMNADIDGVQELWQKVQAENKRKEITFIIAFQKEMVMKHPHFFIGKLDIITLKPLRPEELIEAYKLHNKTIEPFTEDALRLIGELSRGIFRRFLKYIQITIEKNLNTEMPLNVDHVNNAITEDLLIEDMELELSDIFKAKDKKAQAVRVLNFLRQHGESNIKTIAKELDLSETITRKLVEKLRGYRYVHTRRGKGNEKLVSLKS